MNGAEPQVQLVVAKARDAGLTINVVVDGREQRLQIPRHVAVSAVCSIVEALADRN